MKEKKISIYHIIPVLLSLIFIAIACYTFNRTIVMDDEGWYLFLLRDMPNGAASSQFYKLLHNFLNGNVFLLRVFNYAFELFSIFIYSFGIYLFFKRTFDLSRMHLLLLFSFTLLGFSIFTIPVCTTPYYVSLNKISTLISLGILLIGLKTNGFIKNLSFVLSGFSIGFLFFIMITNTPIYLLFIILIYSYSQHKQKDIILFIGGITLSFVCYFLTIELPVEFIQHEIMPHVTSTVSAKHNEAHGLFPMMRWAYMALKYYLFNGLLFAFMIIGYFQLKSRLSTTKNFILFLALLTSGLFFYYEDVIKGEHAYASMAPYWGLYIFFIIDQTILKNNLKHIELFLISLLFIPFLLSLGTDVDFKTRGTEYIGFLFPLLFIITEKFYSKKVLIVFMVVLMGYTVNICSMIYRNNWGGFIYAKQTLDVQNLNIDQNLKVDSMTYNNLSALKSGLLKNDTIIVSNKRLWGYAYLLGTTPISYMFRGTEENWLSQLRNHPKISKLSVFETVFAPMEEGTIEHIKKEGKYVCDTTINVSGIYRIYKLKKVANIFPKTEVQ